MLLNCGVGEDFFFFFLVLKIWNASRICVSSLRRGHANLLCIVPILVYVLLKRALEKTLESPLDSKEIQPVHPKGNQS